MQTASNLLSVISMGTPSNPPSGLNARGASSSANDGLGALNTADPSSPAPVSFLDILAEALAPAQTDPTSPPLPALAIASPAIPANLPNTLSVSLAAGPPLSALVHAPAPVPAPVPALVQTETGDQSVAVVTEALIPTAPKLDEPLEPRPTETDIANQPASSETVVQAQIPLPIAPMVTIVAASPQASQAPTADRVAAGPGAAEANAALPGLSPSLAPRAGAAKIGALADNTAPAAAPSPAISLPASTSDDKLTKDVAPPLANPAPDAPTHNRTPEARISFNPLIKPQTQAQPSHAGPAPAAPAAVPTPVTTQAVSNPSDGANPSIDVADNAPIAPLSRPPATAQSLPPVLDAIVAKLNIDPAVPIVVAATTKPALDAPLSTLSVSNASGMDALVANRADDPQAGLDTLGTPPATDDGAAMALVNTGAMLANTNPVKAPSVAPEAVPTVAIIAAKAPEAVPKPGLAPVPERIAYQTALVTAAEPAGSDPADSVAATLPPETIGQAKAARPAPVPVRTADNTLAPTARPATAPASPSGEQGQGGLEQDAQSQGGQAGGAPRLMVKAETAAPAVATEAKDTPVIQPLAATSQTQASSADRQTTATAQTVPLLANEILRKSGGRSAQFDISLTPEGLGKVDVQISINQKGELTASMVFDTPQAAAELRGRAAELQKSLEQSGFQVSQNGLSFSDTSRQGFGTAQQQAQHDQRQGPGHTRAFIEASDTATLTDLAAAKAYTASNSRSIDVRI